MIEKSKRAQYTDAQKVRDSFESQAIVLAAAQSKKLAGNKDAGFVIQRVASKTGLTAAKAKAAIINEAGEKPTKVKPVQALAFMLNNNFTRAQYESVQSQSKVEGADIWPSYQKVQNAKAECRPKEISVDERCAQVPLQQLLDHTTSRVFAHTAIEAQMLQIAEENGGNLKATFYFKYGFDGSGSHHRAMQPDSMGDLPECQTLNASQMVPLRLVAHTDNGETVLYDNPRPNNPHSCRPIRLAF